VVDANNGAVLHAAAPDAPRHPASLTKIMTLYLLFERHFPWYATARESGMKELLVCSVPNT